MPIFYCFTPFQGGKCPRLRYNLENEHVPRCLQRRTRTYLWFQKNVTFDVAMRVNDDLLDSRLEKGQRAANGGWNLQAAYVICHSDNCWSFYSIITHLRGKALKHKETLLYDTSYGTGHDGKSVSVSFFLLTTTLHTDGTLRSLCGFVKEYFCCCNVKYWSVVAVLFALHMVLYLLFCLMHQETWYFRPVYSCTSRECK